MDSTKIDKLYNQLQFLSSGIPNRPIPLNVVISIREGIVSVAQQISEVDLPISNHLLALKNNLFIEIPFQGICINSVVYGRMLEAIDYVKGRIFATNQTDGENLCRLLHPDILKVSEKLYRDGSYAEAACNAFIEINSRLKELYQAAYPDSENIPDGQALMNKVFSDNDPLFEAGDRTTQTGKDLQTGTRFLFAGAMAALRNPKAHKNITLGEDDCLRQLIFASMLMFKIDEIIATFESKRNTD